MANYTIENPILRGFNPDPSICRVADDYYIAVSTFEWFPGVQIFHSKDLKNWTLISRPLKNKKFLNMRGNPDSGGVWAPCLSYDKGVFYLIYSDIKVVSGPWKDTYNYLTTCETIDGEWSDPIYLNSSGFDPSLFHDESGKKYLVNMLWDHRSTKHGFAGIVLQEYSTELKQLVGVIKNIYQGSKIRLTEAPHLYFYQGYYYLLVAEGGTGFEHTACIVRSKNIDGPYEQPPNSPLISSWNDIDNPLQKAGHASLIHTHTDEWYAVHLVGRPYQLSIQAPIVQRGYCSLGRETAIQKIYWDKGWPYVVGGISPSIFVDGLQGVNESFKPVKLKRYYFDTERLPDEFQTLRIPFDEEIGRLDTSSKTLKLIGRESLTSMFTQALIARRWQHFSFRVETQLSFMPDNFQQQAGLICYYNTQNWVSINITFDETYGRVLDIMQSELGQLTNLLNPKDYVIPENIQKIQLVVEVERDKFNFLYSLDNKDFIRIPMDFLSYKLSDDYRIKGAFFTGAFVGIHCNDTSGNRISADFYYFEYEGDNEKRVISKLNIKI